MIARETPARTHALSRTDWAIIILSVTVAGCVVYLMLDPDPAIRRIQYYRAVANGFQRAAFELGTVGLAAEIEYRRLLELEHIN